MKTGIAVIDDLWTNAAAPSLARGSTDVDAVGAIQDLLIGHGARLPGIVDRSRGVFGPQTEASLLAFQRDHDLAPTGTLDHRSLHVVAETPAASPVAARAYITLVLDMEWAGFVRLVALTAQFEAAGKFTARNRNTDRAGLSFGIIQWAQKPRRLNGLLQAFRTAQPARFTEVFG